MVFPLVKKKVIRLQIESSDATPSGKSDFDILNRGPADFL